MEKSFGHRGINFLRGIHVTAFFVLLSGLLALGLGIAITLYLKAREETGHTERELERFKGIKDLESYKSDLQLKISRAQKILPLFETLAEMEKYKLGVGNTVQQLKENDAAWRESIAAQTVYHTNLLSQVAAVEDNLEMQSFGFYQPKYGFEDSERYKIEIKNIRDHQKLLVRSDRATQCAQKWEVEGSAQKGQKMIKEHSKLMLRAFNGECDAAIAKVKYNNATNLEKRLNRSFEMINKLGDSKTLYLTNEYLNTKLQELYLVHEHRDQVHLEKEEQRRIREQMREEEKALREIERAREKAEEEEAAKEKALEKAKAELENASDTAENAHLMELVAKLELELKDVLERKERAIARAQITRSGHVYVISNVGVFGEGVYKIGMTRRLEPLDRVRELGDASVPFPFDVHAMIYSEDAPGLEHALHQHFAEKRLNLVNLRREFFRVTLNEVKQAVSQHYKEMTFVSFPEAEEFRRSNSLRAETGHVQEVPPAQTQP